MPFDNLNSQTFDISEEGLDALLGLVPDGTANANTLQHSKEPEKKEIETEDKTVVDFNTVDKEYDLDDLLNSSDKKEEDKDDTKESEKETKEEVKTTKTKSKKEEEVSDSALKQITDFYIQKGVWKDFEGREELEYDSETFQDILIKQNEELASDKFNELLDSVGSVGKSIISHIQNGGKPDDIIDLFKEQKINSEFESDNVDHKKAYIAQYYRDVHGFSPEKIRRLVTAAEADDTLDEEISDIKTSYDRYYGKELERIQKEQDDYNQKQKEAEEQFQTSITSEIQSRKNLSEKDKKNLQDVLLNYDQKLADGTKVNKLYVAFSELQKDPKRYIDFVEFVMNPEKFIGKIQKEEETKATQKAFFKIKRNETIDKKTGSSHINNSNSEDEPISLWKF